MIAPAQGTSLGNMLYRISWEEGVGICDEARWRKPGYKGVQCRFLVAVASTEDISCGLRPLAHSGHQSAHPGIPP